MIHIGSELGNMGAASSARAQQFHDAAMRSGAEHLRVAHDALPHRSHRRRVIAAVSVLLVLVGAVVVVVVALVGIG